MFSFSAFHALRFDVRNKKSRAHEIMKNKKINKNDQQHKKIVDYRVIYCKQWLMYTKYRNDRNKHTETDQIVTEVSLLFTLVVLVSRLQLVKSSFVHHQLLICRDIKFISNTYCLYSTKHWTRFHVSHIYLILLASVNNV